LPGLEREVGSWGAYQTRTCKIQMEFWVSNLQVIRLLSE
jgi:hypothetical protein